jgi:glycosyltransferase involved in cell wall biosynthesis
MHVLVLPKWYPGRNDPQLGDFIRKQMLAVATHHLMSVVYPCPLPGLSTGHEQVLDESDGAWELRCYYRPSGCSFTPLRKLLNFLRYRKALFQGIARMQDERGPVDLVHAHIFTRPVLMAWRLARRWNTPFIVSEQSSEHLNGTWSRKHAWAKALDRFLAHRAARTIAVSPHLAKALEQLHPPSPIMVVPNVLPACAGAVEPAGPADQFLMVADLVDRTKNISGVLRALKLAHDQGHALQLEIIGDGADRAALEHLAGSLGIGHAVRWRGKLPNTEVLKYMARTGTVIINSPVETFSVVTGEALALGRPVIATRCGGPEAFITPTSGVLVPVADDIALSKAMIDMSVRHAHYPPDQVQASVAKGFSKEAVGSLLDAVYKAVITHG